MAKRRSDVREGGRTAKRRRRRRHLYLVFDDWVWGYSIRKVDLSPAGSDSDDDDQPTSAAAAVDRTEHRLPPAVFRVEAPHGMPHCFAAAFGTKIMAMHPHEKWAAAGNTHPLVPARLVPAYDVRTRGLVFGPRPPLARPSSFPRSRTIYIPVGDRLFALGAGGSFAKLYPPPLDEPGGEGREWSWRALQKPSFDPAGVTTYAVHPDGSTIFFSTGGVGHPAATFTFDTSEDTDTDSDSFRWTRRGEWALPFAGGAHYDRHLDAWVGLSDDPDALGHLCSCDVVAAEPPATASFDDAGDGERRRPPATKLTKEDLFASEDPFQRHVRATLVAMGGRSRYCLVQCICIEYEYEKGYYYEEDDDRADLCRYLFRLTTFSLKYDKNGDLTTGNSCRVRYYKVPERDVTQFNLIDPVAFWI